jgi:hypothetical protein
MGLVRVQKVTMRVGIPMETVTITIPRRLLIAVQRKTGTATENATVPVEATAVVRIQICLWTPLRGARAPFLDINRARRAVHQTPRSLPRIWQH